MNLVLALALILWLFPGRDARADLSFMAGDGKYVAYGRSLMTCNLPIDASGTQEDVQCLLVGTVKGIPVVAATNQTGATAGKLYMVQIIDSGHARFSGSLANIVDLQLHDTTLAELMTVPQWGYPFVQLLEVPNPDDPDTHPILLLVNGTETLYMLDLTVTSESTTGLKLLKAAEYHRWTSDVPMRFINIDWIDINAYVKHPADKVQLPAAIAIWYQRNDMFWDNRNFRTQANSVALAHLSRYDLDIYQKLEDVEPFEVMAQGPDVWARPGGPNWMRAVAGGAFVNPDAKGAIQYWFGYEDIEWHYWLKILEGRITTVPILTGASLEIYYNQDNDRVYFKNFNVHNKFRWTYVTAEWGRADDEINKYMRYGAWLRLHSDEAGALYIDGNCTPKADSGPYWDLASDSIGTLQQHMGATWSKVEQISEYDDNATPLTEMQRKEKMLVNQGVQVRMVIYGWPYFGNKGTPTRFNTPSFSRNASSETVSWVKTSNGVGFNAEFGIQEGMPGVRKSSFSVIGGYSWSEVKQNTFVETIVHDISEGYDESQIQFDQFAQEGLVVFETLKPTLQSYRTFLPQNASSINVEGVDSSYEFDFPVATAGVDKDTGLTYLRFDVTNPTRSALSDDPSPLSNGLAERKINTLRPGMAALDADVKAIEKWETDNHVNEFVALAQDNQAGLKKVDKFKYCPATGQSMTYSRKSSHEDAIHMDWYTGIHYKTEPGLVGVMAEGTVKYTGSYDQSETQSTGDAYSLAVRGIADPSYDTRYFATYFIEVDISQLKNWIARNKDDPKNPFKGRPSLIPEWNWRYQQNFTLVVTKYDGLRFKNTAAISRLFDLEGWGYEPGAKTLVSLVEAYNANGFPMVLGLRQEPAPEQVPENLYLPLGIVSFQAKKSYPGVCAKFTVYIDGNVPINGFWVKKAGSGKWVNIAKVVVWQPNFKRTRLTLFAEDGTWPDGDRTTNGNLTIHAAPGYRMSHRQE